VLADPGSRVVSFGPATGAPAVLPAPADAGAPMLEIDPAIFGMRLQRP
jgi:hypothetical protein